MKNKKPEKLFLYGKHPVLEAIKNPRRKILKLFCTKNSLNFLYEKLGEKKLSEINTEILRPDQIDRILKKKGTDITHQGIALETTPLEQPPLEFFEDEDLLVACNKVTDPHNIGAILRNALAFGAKAVITDERNSPPENATIAKTSAGCIEKIPYIRGKGLSNSINNLKKQGFLIIGLDGSGEYSIGEVAKKLGNEKIVLVVGSEGKGMTKNIIDLCDYVTKIEISEQAESLNASVASAVALFALYNRQ